MGTLTHDRKPPLWPLLVFSGAACLFVVPLATGTADVRAGAAIALAGMFGGLAFATAAVRKEHLDDAPMPPFAVLVREAAAEAAWLNVLLAAYVVVLYLVVATPDNGESVPSGPVAAAVAASIAVAAVLVGVRKERAKAGIEREVFLRATSIAFFVTVLSSVVYALFESLAGAPTISMWAVWSVGMASWAVAATVLQRRLS